MLNQKVMGRNMMSSNMKGQNIYSNMMGHQMSANMMGRQDMTNSMMNTNMMGRNMYSGLEGRGMHSMIGLMNAYTNNVNQLPLGQRNTMSQRMAIEQMPRLAGAS